MKLEARDHDGLEDQLDRLLSVTREPAGSGVTFPVATYGYVGPTRLARRTSGNGVVLAPSYDTVRRPTGLKHENATPGGAALFAWRYAYDRSSNRTLAARDHDGGLEDRFRYDSASRLVETLFDQIPAGGPPATPLIPRGLDSRNYLLDGVSNRAEVTALAHGETTPISTAYVASSTNAYTQVGPRALTNDRNGNLTDDGAGRRFEFDAFNRLVIVTTATAVTHYGYDASGRRTRSDVTPMTGAVPGLTVSTRFFYDGLRCVEERTVGGPRDGEVRELVHGGRLDEVLLSTVTSPSPTPTTRLYYHHEDVEGNTVGLTDAGAASVDQVGYDEWGVPFFKDAAAHTTTGNEYLFQGLRLDHESSLYYVRARAYDPELGRFIQRDPAGVWGDPLNLGNPYTFAGNNPVTQGDPLGLVTVVQLGPGFTSCEAEVRDIQAARAAHTSTFAYQLGLTFASPELMKGIVREKALAGDLDEFQTTVEATANSWQMKVGMAALSMTPYGGFMVSWTFAAHEAATTGNPMAVLSTMVSGELGPLTSFALEGLAEHDLLPADAQEVLGVGSTLENCFLASTNVETASRGGVAVEDVRVGDRIAPPPGHSCEDPRCGEVVRLFRNTTDQVVTITAVTRPRARERRAAAKDSGEAGEEDGEPPSSGQGQSQTIRCTPGHPFFVEGKGWVLAGDLRVGDELEARGERVVVAAVEVRAERAETFNFEVACHHTYRVSGQAGQPAVLVHNTSRLKALARGTNLMLGLRNHFADAVTIVRKGFRTQLGELGQHARDVWDLSHRGIAGIVDDASIFRTKTFPNIVNRVIRGGGRLKFNLTGLSPNIAGTTTWELQQLFKNKRWFGKTDFFLNGAHLKDEALEAALKPFRAMRPQ